MTTIVRQTIVSLLHRLISVLLLITFSRNQRKIKIFNKRRDLKSHINKIIRYHVSNHTGRFDKGMIKAQRKLENYGSLSKPLSFDIKHSKLLHVIPVKKSTNVVRMFGPMSLSVNALNNLVTSSKMNSDQMQSTIIKPMKSGTDREMLESEEVEDDSFSSNDCLVIEDEEPAAVIVEDLSRTDRSDEFSISSSMDNGLRVTPVQCSKRQFLIPRLPPTLVQLSHTSSGTNVSQDNETYKREIKLLKNRESARECRKKKNDYVRCLEHRVSLLENQNQALIRELASLKMLFCKQESRLSSSK